MNNCEHEYENANCTNCANGLPCSAYECARTRGIVKENKTVDDLVIETKLSIITEFQEWLKTQIVGIDNITKEILVVKEDRYELAIDEYKEELKRSI